MTDMLRGPTPSGSPLAVPSPHLLPRPLRPLPVDLHALDDDPVDVSRLLHGEVSFRTSERTRSGSLSSGGPHPPPPPLRRLTFSPRTSLSPPTLRATIGSRPCLKTMQVFAVPSVPPSTPQGGNLARPPDTVTAASGQRST